MKKYTLLFGIIVVAALMLSSCRTSKQACAAYSQTEQPVKTDSPS